MGNWMLFSFGRVSLLFVAGIDAFEAPASAVIGVVKDSFQVCVQLIYSLSVVPFPDIVKAFN